jgi:phage shock protein A
MAANQELRAKLEKALGAVARATEEQQQTRQQLRQAQSERTEWQIRAEHGEKQLAIL